MLRYILIWGTTGLIIGLLITIVIQLQQQKIQSPEHDQAITHQLDSYSHAVKNASPSVVSIKIADSLACAVGEASSLAKSGDVVVLSPACASYDMFDNFTHRGQVFCELIKKMKGHKK